MTKKQYTIVNMGLEGQYIKENGKIMTIERVVDLLNESEQLKKRIDELELLNDGLNYALKNIKKIDVEIDLND